MLGSIHTTHTRAASGACAPVRRGEGVSLCWQRAQQGLAEEGEAEDLGGRRRLRCRGLLFPLHLIISQERKKARVERYNGHDLDGRKSIALFPLPPFVRPSVLLPDSSLFVRPLALSFARSTVACLLLLSFPPPTFYSHGITQKYTRSGSK